MVRFGVKLVTEWLRKGVCEKGGCHRPFDFHKVLKEFRSRVLSEVGFPATILIVFYSDLMKWVQECQEARLCFLASFDTFFYKDL